MSKMKNKQIEYEERIEQSLDRIEDLEDLLAAAELELVQLEAMYKHINSYLRERVTEVEVELLFRQRASRITYTAMVLVTTALVILALFS